MASILDYWNDHLIASVSWTNQSISQSISPPPYFHLPGFPCPLPLSISLSLYLIFLFPMATLIFLQLDHYTLFFKIISVHVLTWRNCECNFFEKGVFAHVIKLKISRRDSHSGWSPWAPKPMTRVFKRMRQRGDYIDRRGEGCVVPEAEEGRTPNKPSCSGSHQKLEEARRGLTPEACTGSVAMSTFNLGLGLLQKFITAAIGSS